MTRIPFVAMPRVVCALPAKGLGITPRAHSLQYALRCITDYVRGERYTLGPVYEYPTTTRR